MLHSSVTIGIFFRGEVQKVFWNSTLDFRQRFRLLPALIFKSFVQKQQSVVNANSFLWTSSPKFVANMIAAWGKKCQLWQKSEAFSFPSQANTNWEAKTSSHEYIKNCVKNLFEASVAFSQLKSFISAHNVYTCFFHVFNIKHRDLFFKNYVSFVGQD
jgi:hypothetical protein